MAWLSEGRFLPGCRAQEKQLEVWNLKSVKHSHQELTWQCWHAENLVPAPQQQWSQHPFFSIRFLPAMAAGGGQEEDGLSPFYIQGNWGTDRWDDSSQIISGESGKKTSSCDTPTSSLLSMLTVNKLAIGQLVTHRAAVRKGKVSSRNYFRLKLNPWEIQGNMKGLRSSIVATAALSQTISQWNTEAVR